jgi:hypothetical protein
MIVRMINVQECIVVDDHNGPQNALPRQTPMLQVCNLSQAPFADVGHEFVLMRAGSKLYCERVADRLLVSITMINQ